MGDTGRPYLIGIDIGTLSSKGIITDASGKVLAQMDLEHAVQYPRPGWAEQDANAIWWSDCVVILRGMLQRFHLRRSDIGAVCVGGAFPNLCVADAEGNPLRSAILFCDSRATYEIEEASELAGRVLSGDEITPKIIWLQKNELGVFRRIRMIFTTHTYVVYHLTGRYCIDFKTADTLGGLFDVTRREWNSDVCATVGIPATLLPQPRSPIEIAGGITRWAAQETGLLQGTPVLVGCGDTLLSLLGCGAVSAGDAMIYYGTSSYLASCVFDFDQFIAHPELIAKGAPYVLGQYLLTGGSLLRWYRDQIVSPGDGRSNYAVDVLYGWFDHAASAIAPGSDMLIVLPHFLGRRMPPPNPLARGVIFGLTPFHTRVHIYRALLESIGYAMAEGLRTIEEQGVAVRRLVAAGGGATSESWRQIVSDITGRSQEYHRSGSPALAGAYLAGRGLGLLDTCDQISQWIGSCEVTRPRQEVHEVYEKLLAVYEELNLAMRDPYAQLARVVYRG